jgi:hypothetical protein
MEDINAVLKPYMDLPITTEISSPVKEPAAP